jgi:hypothetical protein
MRVLLLLLAAVVVACAEMDEADARGHDLLLVYPLDLAWNAGGPRLEALRAEGVVYESAWAASTDPGQALTAIEAGRRPSRVATAGKGLPELLGQAGYAVLEAYDGSQALAELDGVEDGRPFALRLVISGAHTEAVLDEVLTGLESRARDTRLVVALVGLAGPRPVRVMGSGKRVPFVLSAPGLEPALITEPVSALDLMPTLGWLLELPTPGKEVDGRVLQRDGSDAPPAVCELLVDGRIGLRTVIEGGWLLERAYDGAGRKGDVSLMTVAGKSVDVRLWAAEFEGMCTWTDKPLSPQREESRAAYFRLASSMEELE